MSDDEKPPLEVARERTLEALGHHFAHDRLSEDELDRRMREAAGARTTGALRALVADLPQTGPLAPVELPTGMAHRRRVQRLTAFLGETRRNGAWLPAERITVRAILGEVRLDLTDAKLAPVTEIRCTAIAGRIRVLVPWAVELETSGSTIRGEFTDRQRDPDAPPSDEPRIRVTGLALMGEVRVTRAPKPGSRADGARRLPPTRPRTTS